MRKCQALLQHNLLPTPCKPVVVRIEEGDILRLLSGLTLHRWGRRKGPGGTRCEEAEVSALASSGLLSSHVA